MDKSMSKKPMKAKFLSSLHRVRLKFKRSERKDHFPRNVCRGKKEVRNKKKRKKKKHPRSLTIDYTATSSIIGDADS